MKRISNGMFSNKLRSRFFSVVFRSVFVAFVWFVAVVRLRFAGLRFDPPASISTLGTKVSEETNLSLTSFFLAVLVFILHAVEFGFRKAPPFGRNNRSCRASSRHIERRGSAETEMMVSKEGEVLDYESFVSRNCLGNKRRF